MVIEDDVRVFTDEQPALDTYISFGQTVNLGCQNIRVNGYAVGYHAAGFGTNGTGRHEMKGKFLISDNNRMTCVCTPVKSHDDVTIGGKDVNNLSLAFVAPLQSDNTVIHYTINL
jgi:hypothetical protein